MAQVHVTVDIALTVQQLLDGAAQLNTPELENFYANVGLIIANRQGKTAQEKTADVQTPSAFEQTDNGETLPIVETLIPTSITLDSNSLNF